MNTDELIVFYNELAQRSGEGNEIGVQKLLEEKFAMLPEDVQGQIVALLFGNATIEEGERSQILARIHEKGLEAIETLEGLQRKVEAPQS